MEASMSTKKFLNWRLREDQRMRKEVTRAPTRTLDQRLVVSTLVGIAKDPTLTGEQKTALFQDAAAVAKRAGL